MTTTTVPIRDGLMRGRNRYTGLAVVNVDAWARADQAGTVRIEAHSKRAAEIAPAWLEIAPDEARALAAALREAADTADGRDPA